MPFIASHRLLRALVMLAAILNYIAALPQCEIKYILFCYCKKLDLVEKNYLKKNPNQASIPIKNKIII